MNLDQKYVVLDVETNGLNSQWDDLLSISLYRPDTGQTFDRFLPLCLEHEVYTTKFNGITKSMLKGEKRLSQDEVDFLINAFDLKNRTILIYGNLDARFLKFYFKRNRLQGFENFHFYNFKHDIVSSGFTQGVVTKDNLCRMVGIENVNDVHSGLNDCFLEWQLFKTMNGHKWLITDFNVFEFNDDYIIPASFFVNYSNFRYVKPDLPVPKPHIVDEKVFSISGEAIHQFQNNIGGIVIEHLIDVMIGAKKVDSRDFLLENKRKLRYIGSLPNPYHRVPVNLINDGTVSAVREEDESLVSDINDTLSSLKEELGPLVEYLRTEVFHRKRILSQELVVNKDSNILALCDLSNEDAALEVKTFYWPKADPQSLAQLYYESRGREAYLLVMDWHNDLKRRPRGSINFLLRKVTFELLSKEEARVRTPRPLPDKTLKIVKYIKSTLPVTIHCQKCGHDFAVKGHNYRAAKCPFCHPKGLRLADGKSIKRKPADLQRKLNRYMEKVRLASNGNISVIKFWGSNKPATVKCNKCGFIWTTRSDHVIDRPQCPRCAKNSHKQ
jgi:DNA polymerase III epsilon subunit-like protein/Zn finger protein HypA/HybF involved in hydrogenase expression